MKLSCAVIADLLPLYAEELAGEESRALVEEHLRDCPDCRKKLDALRQPKTAAPDGAGALRAVKKDIRRRRLLAALLAALLVFLPLLTLLARSTEKVPMPYEEGLIEVTEADGDGLSFSVDGAASGVDSQLCTDPDSGETTLLIQLWRSRWDRPQGQPLERGSYAVSRTPDRVLYGYGFGREEQKLLYGTPMSGGLMLLPRLVLGYYLLYDAVLAVLFGLLWRARRGKKAGETMRALFFAALAYPVGHLLIKGVQLRSFFVPRDLGFILLAAAAVWGLMMLGWAKKNEE